MGQQSSQLADLGDSGKATGKDGSSPTAGIAIEEHHEAVDMDPLGIARAVDQIPKESSNTWKRKRNQHDEEGKSALPLLEMKGGHPPTGTDIDNIDHLGATSSSADSTEKEVESVPGSPQASLSSKRLKFDNGHLGGRTRSSVKAATSARPQSTVSQNTVPTDPLDGLHSSSQESSDEHSNREDITQSAQEQNVPKLGSHGVPNQESRSKLETPPATDDVDELETRKPTSPVKLPAKKSGRKSLSNGTGAECRSSPITLAGAASAASALTDPAHTIPEDSDWAVYDVPVDDEDRDAPRANRSSSRSRQPPKGGKVTADTPERKKRRLPILDSHELPLARPPQTARRQPRASTALHDYTRAEITTMTDFFDAYRQEHHLSWSQMHDVIHAKALRRTGAATMWTDLVARLPGRNAGSVQKVARRRFHNFDKRGTWTEEDDDALRAAFAEFGRSWTRVGQHLGRWSEDCRDRWRNYLSCGNARVKGEWTKQEEQLLLTAVEECMVALRHAAAQEVPIDIEPAEVSFKKSEERLKQSISWAVVSEKLGGTRSRLQCQYKWKRMRDPEVDEKNRRAEEKRMETKQRKVRSASARAVGKAGRNGTQRDLSYMDRWLPGDYYNLLIAVRDGRYDNQAKIPWRVVGLEPWRTNWTSANRRLAFSALTATVPEADQRPLQDVVQDLINAIEAERPNELQTIYDVGQNRIPKQPRQRKDRGRRAAVARSNKKSSNFVTVSDCENDENDRDNEREPVGVAREPDDNEHLDVQAPDHHPSHRSEQGENEEVQLRQSFMAHDWDAHARQLRDGPDSGDEEDPESDEIRAEREMQARVQLLRHA